MKARDALRENNVFRSEIREHENLKLSRTLKRKQRVPIPKNLLAPIESNLILCGRKDPQV